MYFPWQDELWKRLAGLHGRWPHALLFHGRPGIGKLHLAQVLAQSLLCEQRSQAGLACGACVACAWFASGNHPDFRLVQPEALAPAQEEVEAGEGVEESKKKPSKQIKIEQIRGLSDFLNVGSHRNGYRVVLIQPAESMNPGAANALLKSLEEPSAGVIFLLVSHQPSRLAATVRSRCHALALTLPPRQLSLRWLQEQGSKATPATLAFAGDAPLEAAALPDDEAETRRRLFDLLSQPTSSALSLADFCQRLQPDPVVNWMLKWTYDLIALASKGNARYNIDLEKKLHPLVRSMPLLKLLRFYSALLSLHAIAEHPLNARLFFDDLFIAYKEIG
ncbi:MAG: DNA polymerase III subunit delta' [Betaproteobacteria bacterium RIFCSPLOWO2_12_FULL_64_23]|nr:MAG: DNA polymerase III subunit delta' [Betaproteobacteria bacterium RIFCSPLOWO2_12_FULL_64_23]